MGTNWNWKNFKRIAILFGVPAFYILLPLIMSDVSITRWSAFFSMIMFFQILDMIITIDVRTQFNENLDDHISLRMFEMSEDIRQLKAMVEKMNKDTESK